VKNNIHGLEKQIEKKNANIWNDSLSLSKKSLAQELKEEKDLLHELMAKIPEQAEEWVIKKTKVGKVILKENLTSRIEENKINKVGNKNLVQLSAMTEDQRDKILEYWKGIFPDDPEWAEALAKDY